MVSAEEPEALQVLEQHYRSGTSSTDALGVLAGRLKRRWLAERRAADLERARQLYSEGLARAEAEGDAAQAYYHAINIAFLDLMAAPATAGVPAPRPRDGRARAPAIVRRPRRITGGWRPRRKPP